MITKKILSLFLSILLLCSMVSVASAGNVAAFSYWIDTDQNTLEVMQGDIPQFAVLVESYANSVDIISELVKDNAVVDTLLEVDNYQSEEYYKLLTVNAIDLSGSYQIMTTVSSSSDVDVSVLNLYVQAPVENNNAPVINSAPVLEVPEKNIYGYTLKAFDLDNDELSYSFVQKPSWISGEKKDNNHFKISGFAPEEDGDYNYVVSVKVSDSKEFVVQTFTITVKDLDVQVEPQVESVSILLAWSEDEDAYHSINLGEEAQFVYSVDGLGEDSLELQIDLRKNGVLLNTLVEESTNEEEIIGDYVVGQGITQSGNYVVEATAVGGSGAQDKTYLYLEVLMEDSDEDNIPDELDNCPEDFNPGQEDVDNDGIGNVCEIAPVIEELTSGTVEEGGEEIFSIIVSDENNDTVEVTVLVDNYVLANALTSDVVQTGEGTWEYVFSPSHTFVKHPDTADSFMVTIVASDGDASTVDAQGVFEVVVEDVNQVPMAEDMNVIAQEDASVGFVLSGLDADMEDVLNYQVMSAPSQGTLSGVAPNLIYTPGVDYVGEDSFTFTVVDQLGSISEEGEVTITVNPENDAPVALDLVVNTQEDTPVFVFLGGTDSDGTVVDCEVTSVPVHGLVEGSGCQVTYMPEEDFNGADSFIFVVEDDSGAISFPATVNVEVIPVNDAPVALDMVVNTQEDTPVEVLLEGTDVDGIVVIYQIMEVPTQGTLSGVAPNLIYTPGVDYVGEDSFTFVVIDNEGAGSSIGTVTIDVGSVNDLPVAVSQSVMTNEEEPVFVFLEGEDSDGTVVDYLVVEEPEHGSLEFGATIDEVIYTPEEDFNGVDSFTFVVIDNEGGESLPAAVTITVGPVNDVPVVMLPGPVVQTEENKELVFGVWGYDLDEGETLEIGVVDLPEGATMEDFGTPCALVGPYQSCVGQKIVWTPTYTQAGEYEITFVVVDSSGAISEPKIMTIVVGNINSAPTITSSPARTWMKDAPYTYQVAVSDIEGDGYTFDLIYGPKGMELDSEGLLTWTPNNHGTFCMMMQVKENTLSGLTAEQHWCVDVRDLDKSLTFNNVNLASEFVPAGDYLQIYVDLQNGGDEELEDLKITATIYELGIKKTAGNFNLGVGENAHKQIWMEIPYDTELGEYDVRVTASNSEVNHVAHRLVEII